MERSRDLVFPEIVDLNQGVNFDDPDMTGDEWGFAPTERRVSSNEITGEKSFGSWDAGESSSRPSVQNNAANNNNGNGNNSNNRSDVIPVDMELRLDPGVTRAVARGLFTSNPGQFSAFVNAQEPTNQRSTNSSQRSPQTPAFNENPFAFLYGASTQPARSNVNRVNVRSCLTNGDIVIPNLNATTNDEQVPNLMIPNLNTPTIDELMSTSIIDNMNPIPNEDQVFNDPPRWDLFPGLENESGGRRRHARHFPSRPSSSRNPPRYHQPPLRLEIPDEDVLGDDFDGRYRWLSEVRQILSVLRRGENLNDEDYMLIDPVINRIADLHDRHRDMRLDVDNMSYEELLALEERIGDVKTGLTEEAILNLLKPRKHFSFMAIATQNSEPCCICQEEYNNGDDIGTLDCGHEFHIGCIKEWLKQKNLCPICKMPGLSK
ncbi:uncharacterized protein LOC143629459 [Bidens hawaiensis]|uniref:uncharacterized protein LOC143629459 n=1 Tax=Bidens hawaiensis TaxID=980011 RepID=UPI00404B5C29